MAEASDVQMLSFTDRSVPLVFQQNQRARRIILRLDYGSSRIVVVLPKRTSRDEGKRFVLSNKEWIAERLDQLPESVPFEHGAVIPFLGLDHRIRHRPTARGVVWCED
ncbi:MAG TPA: YgjP-like metallopeptidase domain-containing protein, partial [Dongiaceae bacterium]